MLAIANPAKLDVTYCCPQLISWKGSAVLIIPIIPNRRQAVSLVVKSFPPRISQIIEVITVANTILAEVSQRGVIPLRANSMNRKVEPHTIPNVDIITQCLV